MTCEIVLPQLEALLDGELTAEIAAEAERHLAVCAACAAARAECVEVREMADAWTVAAPDIRGRVLVAVKEDDQYALLTEIQSLRSEMQSLREEVAALRRQLSSRPEAPLWTPPTRRDYRTLEDDPWNLIRS